MRGAGVLVCVLLKIAIARILGSAGNLERACVPTMTLLLRALLSSFSAVTILFVVRPHLIKITHGKRTISILLTRWSTPLSVLRAVMHGLQVGGSFIGLSHGSDYHEGGDVWSLDEVLLRPLDKWLVTYRVVLHEHQGARLFLDAYRLNITSLALRVLTSKNSATAPDPALP